MWALSLNQNYPGFALVLNQSLGPLRFLVPNTCLLGPVLVPKTSHFGPLKKVSFFIIISVISTFFLVFNIGGIHVSCSPI
jgi:hypothetical protein